MITKPKKRIANKLPGQILMKYKGTLNSLGDTYTDQYFNKEHQVFLAILRNPEGGPSINFWRINKSIEVFHSYADLKQAWEEKHG